MQTYERKKIDNYFEFPLLLNVEEFQGVFEDVKKATGISMEDVD